MHGKLTCSEVNKWEVQAAMITCPFWAESFQYRKTEHAREDRKGKEVKTHEEEC